MFWIVTLVAAIVVVRAVLMFLRTGFAHPVAVGGDIIVKSAIWVSYFSIVRELRVARGQVANALAMRVEVSAALCCLMGYMLVIPQFGWRNSAP
jgi:hypothetical protein